MLLRDVTEAEGAARVFDRWEQVLEGSPGRLNRQQETAARQFISVRVRTRILRTDERIGIVASL